MLTTSPLSSLVAWVETSLQPVVLAERAQCLTGPDIQHEDAVRAGNDHFFRPNSDAALRKALRRLNRLDHHALGSGPDLRRSVPAKRHDLVCSGTRNIHHLTDVRVIGVEASTRP